VQSFTIGNVPATPGLSTPANTATYVSLTPTVAWNAASGASTYRVQLSTSSGFTSLIVDDSSATGTTKQVSSLSMGTTYYWRVHAINNCGDSPWSTAWSFTTGSPPGTPTLSSPTNNGTGEPLAAPLYWNSVTGASTYTVQVSTSSSFSTLAFVDSTDTASSRTTSTLNGVTTYYWRVNAKNAFGTGSWSSVWNFQTTATNPPAVPTLSSPPNNATHVSPNPSLTWSGAYASSYEVEVSSSSTFSSLIVDDIVTTTSDGLPNGTLSCGAKYYWRVDGINNLGTSSWSSVWSFTTNTTGCGGGEAPISVLSTNSLDQITVQDGNKLGQSLYLMHGARKLNPKFIGVNEIPPVTPPGVFDARFHSGKFVESVPPSGVLTPYQIAVKDALYPLTVSWNLKAENSSRYWLHVTGRANDKVELTGQGSMKLASPVNGELLVDAQTTSEMPLTQGTQKQIVDETAGSVKSFSLLQNYPNPFNPTTTIRYELPVQSNVELVVFNILGQQVATLANEVESGGIKYAVWNAGNNGSGLYFFRLRATPASDPTKPFSQVRRMLLVK